MHDFSRIHVPVVGQHGLFDENSPRPEDRFLIEPVGQVDLGRLARKGAFGDPFPSGQRLRSPPRGTKPSKARRRILCFVCL